jgi:hypothetical protein
VANGDPIPFNSLDVQATDSAISLPSNGTFRVNDFGFYQISWGYAVNTGTDTTFQLQVDGSGEFYTQLALTNAFRMVSTTMIVELSADSIPHDIEIVNTTGSSRDLEANATLTGVAAYITIIKLQ